jgi:hypothetical protein
MKQSINREISRDGHRKMMQEELRIRDYEYWLFLCMMRDTDLTCLVF